MAWFSQHMLDYQYAYLIGDLIIGLPLWSVLFFGRKDLRREMLIVSLLIGIAGPVSEYWYTQDYWQPQTFTGTVAGLEDFLFGFFVGGIASAIYEGAFGRRFAKRKDRSHHWSWFLLPMVALLIFSLNLLVSIGLNSIYASVITFIGAAGVMVYYRRDLLVDSLMSGLLVGAIMFLGYLVFLSIFPQAVHRWWFLNNISGILVAGIPIEELMWAFGWGMFAGPVYEFFAGLRFKKSAKRIY